MNIQWITIGISILALIFSLISLWKTYLAPFKLKMSHDQPRFSIYRVIPEMSDVNEIWWIPSIDMDFTFHNVGCKLGQITDLRLLAIIKTKDKELKYSFYPKWVVDFSKFAKNRGNRSKWIENSILRDWYPLILAKNEQQSLHLVFEVYRWEEKIIGDIFVSLQIFTSEKPKWIEIKRYNMILTEEMYEHLFMFKFNDYELGAIRKSEHNWYDNLIEDVKEKIKNGSIKLD